MHVYIIYAHPRISSFTAAVLESFTTGLRSAGHTYEVADLYRMGFASEMSADEFQREVGMDPNAPVPADVAVEQQRVSSADALAFIYPVWWSDCPAKLKGWFDRVLTYGFAYCYDENQGRSSRVSVKKALVICPAGHTTEHLEEIGIAQAMRRTMLDDRLLGIGIQEARMEILGGMMPGSDVCGRQNIQRAYELGLQF
jgi:NAD(P)H dehydrogenase (quinone)